MKQRENWYRFWVVWALMILPGVLPSSAFAFSATARVDRTRISLSDTVTLQVITQGGEARVDMSPVTDFKIISSGTQSSRSYINGTWKHEMTYVYYLVPEKSGMLKIPPLKVTGEDGSAVTRAIEIRCDEKAADGSGAADSPIRFRAKAELDTAEAVPGQQVVYTLRLFSPPDFSGAKFTPPDFTGLDVRELSKWKKYTRTENGLARVVNEMKLLIQAPGPGTYGIGPAVFTVQEAVPGSRQPGTDPFGSFFNDPFFDRVQTRPVRVASNRLSLKVRPLPPYEGKVPFSGLVGDFTMAASLDKKQVATGESVTLSIVVQGRGNVTDIGSMTPQLDKDLFKVYPDAPVEEMTPDEKGLAGKKTFRIALVPKHGGKAAIPPVSLNFFNPSENRYKTITTSPLNLEILPGKTAASPAPPDARKESADGRADGVKSDVKIENRDILEIREDISAITPVSKMPLSWFAFWLALPGAGFAVFALILGQRRRQPDPKTLIRKKARDLIRRAEAAGPCDPGFLPALQGGLTALILSRAGREGENLTRAEAAALLEESGVDQEKAARMVRVMDTLDQARFSGKTMDEQRARDCLKQVKTWAKTLVLVAAAGLTLWTSPFQARASEQATRFVDAVRDYKAGRFDQAARGFESIAASGVENPVLYYDTANAWLRADDLGRAVLWYERALRLAPSDPDIRFNLAHARSLVKDRIDTPLTLQDIFFFWKGSVSLKTLQTAAVAASFLFFIWAGIRVWRQKRIFTAAGAGLLAVLVLLTAAALMERGRLSSDTRAVILAPKVAVRSGTQEAATPLFDLHRGVTVHVLEKKGNYIKIGIAGDKVGWVSLAEAEII